jgi:putative endonuclease
MAQHNETGKKGEELALIWFQENGYEILHQNWRHGRDEIDLIAQKQGCLHFIEVKTRTSLRFGYPEESVTDLKLNRLFRAAEAFLDEHTGWKRVQYDVLSVYLPLKAAPEYFLLEDVYLSE